MIKRKWRNKIYGVPYIRKKNEIMERMQTSAGIMYILFNVPNEKYEE